MDSENPAIIANLLKTMAPELRTANNELPPHLSYDLIIPPNIQYCAIPGALHLPHPNSSLACSAPSACDLPALVPALSFSPKLKRFLRDLGITGPSGEHLPYWDQISYTRFLFDFW